MKMSRVHCLHIPGCVQSARCTHATSAPIAQCIVIDLIRIAEDVQQDRHSQCP